MTRPNFHRMICASKKTWICLAIFLSCFFSVFAEESLDYVVKFEGVQDKQLSDRLKNASELIKLKKHLPKTEEGLRRRAQKDLPKLARILRNQGYYNARVSVIIEMRADSAHVIFHLNPGVLYPISQITLEPEIPDLRTSFFSPFFGKPATTANIRNCETQMLLQLAQIGYPLASIEKREIIADQKQQTIHLQFALKLGPRTYFGPISISGLESIKRSFIIHKLGWKYGEIYDQKKIDTTLHNMEDSGLFNSIQITYNEADLSHELLPISIDVSEAKMRSIGFGFGYSTQRGPGFTGEWQHRNYRGMGEKLTLNINALTDTQEASVSYVIPDFFKLKQDLIYAVELDHDLTKGYEKTSFAISGTLERWVSERSLIAFGGMYEYLKSSEENENGERKTERFHLIRIPLKWRWSNVDDFMDPTRGTLFFSKLTPTFQAFGHSFLYTTTTLTGSFYKPLFTQNRVIFATKVHLGSIWGTTRDSIPGSERFNAGSDNLLRGYRYHTVSEISYDGDPTGGQSIIVYSAEIRGKVNQKWGTVLFYDAGNVFSGAVPRFNRKLLRSTGLGIRYYTPVGPLRLDLAFPIDRRKVEDKEKKKFFYLDNRYEIYFSVGQSF